MSQHQAATILADLVCKQVCCMWYTGPAAVGKHWCLHILDREPTHSCDQSKNQAAALGCYARICIASGPPLLRQARSIFDCCRSTTAPVGCANQAAVSLLLLTWCVCARTCVFCRAANTQEPSQLVKVRPTLFRGHCKDVWYNAWTMCPAGRVIPQVTVREM